MNRGDRLVMVGAGRIGPSLAADLSAAGAFDAVTVVGRRAGAPDFLAARPDIRYVGVAGAAPGPDRVARLLAGAEGRERAVPGGDPPPRRGGAGEGSAGRRERGAGPPERVVVFSVPDDRLEEVAAGWAAALAAGPAGGAAPDVVLHTSGRHPSAVLAPFRALGSSTGAWHPLVALAAPRTGGFRGIAVGIEGRARALETAARLAGAVGARTLRVREDRKRRYHAAAVFASNHLASCLAVAVRELRAACGEDAGVEDLLPLARSALAALDGGLREGVTGPIVRGDVETVRGHLEALDPPTADLYRALAAELLGLVGDRLPGTARRELEALVEGPPPGRRATG